MGILNTILDIVFPVNCFACGKRGSDLCSDCVSNFPKAERQCESWIFPLFDYRHENVKRAVWLLKYGKKKRLADIFGDILARSVAEEISELSVLENFRDPILVPIPLSKKRYKERGYNQAELLCRKIATAGLPITHTESAIRKIKETEHQAHLKERSERLKNLIGSFAVGNSQLVAGRNIILIDDVTTTGATLGEAKKVLKDAGAKKIIAFTIAH